jgi:hypothetical protein
VLSFLASVGEVWRPSGLRPVSLAERRDNRWTRDRDRRRRFGARISESLAETGAAVNGRSSLPREHNRGGCDGDAGATLIMKRSHPWDRSPLSAAISRSPSQDAPSARRSASAAYAMLKGNLRRKLQDHTICSPVAQDWSEPTHRTMTTATAAQDAAAIRAPSSSAANVRQPAELSAFSPAACGVEYGGRTG